MKWPPFFQKPGDRFGMTFLAAWLILSGILHLVPRLHFPGSDVVLAVLALVTGVLLLMRR